MKKILLSIFVVALSSLAFASVFDVWTSSHTATVDTTQVISAVPAVLNGVCINKASTTGTLTLYNSNGTATNIIAVLDSTVKSQCSNYNVYCSSGISYSNTGSPAADVTILWNKFSH